MSEIDALFLTKYARKGASSRYRSLQYFPYLERADIQCSHEPLFSNAYLKTFYETGTKPILHVLQSYVRRIYDLLKVRRFDVVVIEKELLPYTPALFERVFSRLSVPYIVDYDDAIFHNYDKSENPLIRRLLRRKIDVVMRKANVVISGNEYLASRARKAGAERVEIIPTVIDLDKYPDNPTEFVRDEFVIGWIGSPSTAQYVKSIAPAIREVCDRHDGVTTRLIGSGEVDLPGIPHEIREWSEETEIDDLHDICVGIMPLEDSPWERGKCGFKLIQYMGCWKPVIASPIGINRQIVTEGITGYFASNRKEWVNKLEQFVNDTKKAKEFGKSARQKVERRYCLSVTAPKLIGIIREISK